MDAVSRFLINLCGRLDILILTETHASVHVQKGYEESLKHVHFAWAGCQTHAGVAIIARKSSFWDFKPVTFDDGPLKTLNQEGRLVASQIFASNGKNSFIILGFYGYAGARWDQQLLQKNNKAISAIFEFAVTKGNLPALLSGDFNVEIEESEPLKEFLAFGQWHDAAGPNQTPHVSCLKGKNGSRIDFFFLNSTAASLLTSYSIRPGLLKKDHQFVTIQLAAPLACQHEYRIKK